MVKTKEQIVTIEEDYLEFRGSIYYAWRVEGAAQWNFRLTTYKELPYIKWKKLTQFEYQDRLRRYELTPPASKKGKKV